MFAVENREIRDEAAFWRLLDLHTAEIRNREGKIEELIEMLERQAIELAAARNELNAFKARLARAAA